MYARIREMALEEGGKAGMGTVAHAAWTWARHRQWPWRAYVSLWLVLLTAALAAPPVSETTLPPLPSPAELAPLYAHMPSIAVSPDTDLTPVWRDLARQQKALNMTCLAAIHVGVPLRVAVVPRVHNHTVVRLVNPVLVAGVGQGRLSAAYETSAFWPDRRAVRVERAVPVTVRDAYATEHVFETREEAHCVLHCLDAFDGRTPYDVAAPRKTTFV